VSKRVTLATLKREAKRRGLVIEDPSGYSTIYIQAPEGHCFGGCDNIHEYVFSYDADGTWRKEAIEEAYDHLTDDAQGVLEDEVEQCDESCEWWDDQE
jgi:hypothetical protein